MKRRSQTAEIHIGTGYRFIYTHRGGPWKHLKFARNILHVGVTSARPPEISPPRPRAVFHPIWTEATEIPGHPRHLLPSFPNSKITRGLIHRYFQPWRSPGTWLQLRLMTPRQSTVHRPPTHPRPASVDWLRGGGWDGSPRVSPTRVCSGTLSIYISALGVTLRVNGE